MATKAIDVYMKMVGSDYLRSTLGDLIKSVVTSKRSCEVGRGAAHGGVAIAVHVGDSHGHPNAAGIAGWRAVGPDPIGQG